MIEPINKITCDWCGKFELSTTTTLSKEFYLLNVRHSASDRDLLSALEAPEAEEFLLCTACWNAIQSARSLRMKERRENKASQVATMSWSTVETNYTVRDGVCS